ncbi:MAG: prolyl oligopeptidase family serine peptidase [Planctomycetes bacterium]|nr:prolyl oligopeptidase family serine peptidase [Planctomycetota bacterium]
MPSARGNAKELAEHLLVPFVSSERPLLTLFMDVFAPAHGGPWPPLFMFHGWHQDLTHQRERSRLLAARGFCALNLNLRGRCATVGTPDANGWEVRDAVDALQSARRNFPQLCDEGLPPRAFGASGGGGNVYALAGKCPDLLSAAVAWCGVADYTMWYDWNEAGNYRDEMERWIGKNPRDCAEAYQSRSGVTVAANRICPLNVLHGIDDDCVPIAQARAYAAAARKAPKGAPPLEYRELPNTGHGIPDEHNLAKAAEFLHCNGAAVHVPQRRNWVVAGFLKTHYFEVQWDHVSLVGHMDIDLRRRRITLECPSSKAAQVRLAGPVKEVEIQPPSPKACRVISVRMESGWSVIDLQTHGQPVGLRWSV